MVFQWAKDWVVDKVYGVAKTGIEAGGNLAGNAVGGVGSLVENAGRGVGQGASGIAGTIGGVGGYINNYGQGIIDSTAASGGGGGGEKRYAVKPTQSAAGGKATWTATKSLPSTTTKPATKPLNSSTSKPLPSPSPKQTSLPSKPPPPGPNRNLPAKKPQAQFPQRPAGSTGLPKISSSAADRTPDGKVRVSPASRPKTVQSNGGPNPLPRIAAGKGDRTSEGKFRISPQSRPRPVVSAR